VCVKAFAQERVTGYRWPLDVPILAHALQIGAAETSGSEA